MRHAGSVGTISVLGGARAAGAGLTALALAACSTFPGGDDGLADGAGWEAARAAELAVELAEAKAENAALAQQVAALQSKLKAARDQTLAAETAAVSGGDRGAAAPATPVDPQTVVAAADVNRALANSPAPPVEPAPRLVQPSFASEQETVFENEAKTVIPLTSILYGVHIASYRAAEDARAGWRKMQRDNPDQLGLLEPRVLAVSIEGRGDFLRLIAGGFSSEEKATQLCDSLKARGVFCTVTGFEGERLSLASEGG